MNELKLGTLMRAISRVITLGGSDDHIAQVCEENGWDPTQVLGAAGGPGETRGVPRDVETLKEHLSVGGWHVMPYGTPKQFRTNRDGTPGRPGYCMSKLGGCGDDFPSHDTPYAYRKKDEGGGKVCEKCFRAAGGEEVPYTPKNKPVVADDETLPF